MFDALMNQARSALQGAAPQDVAKAAQEHVQQTDPQELQQHLTQGAQQMDQPSLQKLAGSLLGGLQQHGTSDAELKSAGVPVEAAAEGDKQSVMALIEEAAKNPAGLRTAAVQFVQHDPQLLTKLPGLVQGVLQKLG